MKVYVAARIEDRVHAEEAQRQFIAAGVEVTSRWMAVEAAAPIVDYEAEKDETTRRLEMDLTDVREADVLVVWKPKSSHRDTTGGHHVETGYALALGKPIFLIGSLENIFHRHTSVRECDTIEEAVQGVLTLEEKDFPLSLSSVDSFQRWTRRLAIYHDGGKRTARAALYCAVGLGGEAGEAIEKVLTHVRAESDRLLSKSDISDAEAKALENLGPVIGALHNLVYCSKRLEELKRPIRNGTMSLPDMNPFPEDLQVNLVRELGDVSWYVTRLADELSFTMTVVHAVNVAKLLKRKDDGTLHGHGDQR